MITLRPAAERGTTRLDWLDSRHVFSFGDYVDPRHRHFRALRVLNEDFVAPARGFETHGHRDMEILTWVLAGELQHEDSLGNGSAIRPGELQRMTAGTGVTHSERNPSPDRPLHLLQIWILPERKGLPPGYEQRAFAPEGRRNRWQLLAARGGRDGAVHCNCDADVLVCVLQPGATVRYPLRPGRGAWLAVARGEVTLAGRRLVAGDGAAIEHETEVAVTAVTEAEVLLFDLE